MNKRRRSLTKREREDCLEAGGRQCHICGLPIDPVRERWEAEHIIPHALGGSDEWPNLRPAHQRCHVEKTRADVPAIAKAVRVGQRHLGIRTAKSAIPQRPRAAKPVRDKAPLPPRRPMFVKDERPA